MNAPNMLCCHHGKIAQYGECVAIHESNHEIHDFSRKASLKKCSIQQNSSGRVARAWLGI